MFVVSVTIWAKAERIEDFKEAILGNARGTRHEAGNLRFDVCQGTDDPGRFLLHEVYLDEEAFKSHQQTPHYFKWRDAVTDWMAQPRQAAKYLSVFPEGETGW